MKVAALVACVLLAFGTRPAWSADAQSPPVSVASPAAAQPSASQSGTPKKEEKSKPKAHSGAIHKPQAEVVPPETSLGLPLLKNIARDQETIWTSPSRLRIGDLNWLVPLGGVTAGMMAVDSQATHHPIPPSKMREYRKLSDYGAYSLVGAAGGLYLWGKVTNDDHKRETGLLSGEALIDSVILTTAIQRATGRERPLQSTGQGNFFQHGTSFPSNHSAAAWSVASVIAHEYPGVLTKMFAYGMASAVSISRVKSKEHFPSDVFVGGLIGWFVGEHVYRRHHDPRLGGGSWDNFGEADYVESGHVLSTPGSTYVPLDSWVYPALEQLAALRYVSSDLRGMRPWTRTECARLTDEAGEALTAAVEEDRQPGNRAVQLWHALEREFAAELGLLGGGRNRFFQLESAYARVTSLSGPVLNDSYHFGQTLDNDYGRPFRRGTNVVTGAAFEASYDRFFAYGWGEYQHSPSAPALSMSQRQLIALDDGVPLPPGLPFEPVNRFRLLDTYVGMNLGNWQVSFGRQSLWWGSSESGPMLLSNNAEPINMFRVNRIVPLHLPSFLGFLGPIRVDFFVGRLGGHQFARHPWFQGQRIGFKMGRSVEIGITHTAQFGGEGQPNGLDVFFKVLLPFNELHRELTGGPSLSNQEMSLDFQYRMSRFATIYGEFVASDDKTPFSDPRRLAANNGVYFPRLPGLPRFDLRMEGTFTRSPCDPYCAGQKRDSNGNLIFEPVGFLHYWHFTYKNGYTNNGVILGDSVGRAGVSYQGWLTYWLSHQERLQFGFKRTLVAKTFIPEGNHWTDYSVRFEKELGSGFLVRSSLQLERLRYPFLFASNRTNVAAQIELRYVPERKGK